MDEAVQAVAQVGQLSRTRCREVFEEKFTAMRMAQEYLAIYEQLSRGNPLQQLSADAL